MKATLPITLIMIALVTGLACKKEKVTKSRTELLTTGSWHVVAYTVDPAVDWDGDGTKETNVYAVEEPCIKDDRTTFFPNGTGELDEGPTKCNDNDPQTIPITWSFNQNESKITVQNVQYIVDKLTESQLIVKEIVAISSDSYTHTVTFEH